MKTSPDSVNAPNAILIQRHAARRKTIGQEKLSVTSAKRDSHHYFEEGNMAESLWFRCIFTGTEYCYRRKGYTECNNCDRTKRCEKKENSKNPKDGVSQGYVAKIRQPARSKVREK